MQLSSIAAASQHLADAAHVSEKQLLRSSHACCQQHAFDKQPCHNPIRVSDRESSSCTRTAGTWGQRYLAVG